MSTTTNEPIDAVLAFIAIWAPVAGVIFMGLAVLMLLSAVLAPLLRSWWDHVRDE